MRVSKNFGNSLRINGSFNDEQRQFNEEQRQINQQLGEGVEELRQFNEEQRQINRNTVARFDRMEGDISTLKGNYALDCRN